MTTPNKPSHKSIDPTIDTILEDIWMMGVNHESLGIPEMEASLDEATAQIKDLINKAVLKARVEARQEGFKAGQEDIINHYHHNPKKAAHLKKLISKKVIEGRIDELKIFEQHLVDKYEIPPDHPQLHPYFETRTNILKQQLKRGSGETSPPITTGEEKV